MAINFRLSSFNFERCVTTILFQARPPDYPASILSSRLPVSFHKHWELSPLKVYQEYFSKSDKVLRDLIERDEL